MSESHNRLLRSARGKIVVGCLLFCSLGAAITFPFTVEQVWYRGADRPFARAFKAGGDLVVREQSLEFIHPKHGWTLPLEEISLVTIDTMKGDVDTEWVVLAVDGSRSGGLIGLRDGRKMGYGQETRQLYEKLLDVARSRKVAQFDVPAGLVPYEPLDRMVAFAFPEGWSDYQLSQHLNEDFSLPLGRTTFTPSKVASREDLLTNHPRLMVERTDVRDFDRATCRSGLSRQLRSDLLKETIEDPYYLGATAITLEVESAPFPVGPCKGVRLRGAGRTVKGQELEVDLVAVVGSGVLYRFSLVAPRTEGGAGNSAGRLLSQVVATIRLARPD